MRLEDSFIFCWVAAAALLTAAMYLVCHKERPVRHLQGIFAILLLVSMAGATGYRGYVVWDFRQNEQLHLAMHSSVPVPDAPMSLREIFGVTKSEAAQGQNP